MGSNITIEKIWDEEPLAGLATITHIGSIDVLTTTPNGVFSFLLKVAGVTGSSPNVKVWYKLSFDGVEFIKSSDEYLISAGFTKTSGIDADGKTIIQIGPTLAQFIKFYAEELDDEAAIITGILARQ